MIVLDHKRLPKQRAEPAGCGGEQAVALALQASGFAVVTQRCLQGKLAILLAGALIIEQRQRRLRVRNSCHSAWWVISLPSLSVAC